MAASKWSTVCAHLDGPIWELLAAGSLGEALSCSHCRTATSPLGDTSLQMRPFSKMSEACSPSSKVTLFTSRVGCLAPALSSLLYPID